ncbi:MAG: L-rhamnose catabolism isomerase [Steroidobacteraceae bacterium]
MTDALPIDRAVIGEHNAARADALRRDCDHLDEQLARNGLDLGTVKARVATLEIALPSWAVGTGGTRFARYPGPGEPRNVFEKFEDCAVVQQLVRCTPRVSVHFPWDRTDDLRALREFATACGLGFDAVNSNTFQDQPGQQHSYKFGSLTHVSPATRAQAVAHNLEVIEAGRALGSHALTLWIGDGSNLPGQQDFHGAFERYLESARSIYAALPDDWQLLIEHKLYEPALYSTVIQDWGSSLLAANALGPRARCLVDLGHHAPSVNIEMIVARLHAQGKLGGFHFNDSKYGDDDLDSGSINPLQLFLIFNELVAREIADASWSRPAYMIDQSHNMTDPIESLISSADHIAGSYARACLVDRAALAGYQADNDPLMAYQTLKRAYETDVRPLIAMLRIEAGGATDPVAAYRQSAYRKRKTAARPQAATGTAGIV